MPQMSAEAGWNPGYCGWTEEGDGHPPARAAAPADDRGASDTAPDRQSHQRARRSGAPRDRAAGAGWGRVVRAGGPTSRLPERTERGEVGRRFHRRGLAALSIAAGRGRRPTYDAAARGRIVATAQRTPDRRADGTATWSLSTLRRTLRRAGLSCVGTRTIRPGLPGSGR